MQRVLARASRGRCVRHAWHRARQRCSVRQHCRLSFCRLQPLACGFTFLGDGSFLFVVALHSIGRWAISSLACPHRSLDHPEGVSSSVERCHANSKDASTITPTIQITTVHVSLYMHDSQACTEIGVEGKTANCELVPSLKRCSSSSAQARGESR